MEQATGETPATRPRRGELLEVEIDSLAFGGRGVARADGYVVFVAGGAARRPGSGRGHQGEAPLRRGATVELLRPGADRVADRCIHGGEPCPGAPWQGLAYERQLIHKREQVDEALRRIGGLDGFELEEIEPALEQWRYRNKLEYSFGERDGETILGFHARGRWDLIVDVEDCLLASERGNAARNDGPRVGARRSRSPPTTAARGDGRAPQPRRPRGAAHRPDPDPPRHRAGRASRSRRSTCTP